MPLKIGGTIVDSNIASLICKLPNPQITKPEKSFSLDQCLMIDAGEACYSASGAGKMLATRKTSTCFQLYFSQDAKSLLVHFSSDFRLNLDQLFNKFDLSEPIELVIIGGTETPIQKSTRNLVALIKAITNFCQTHPDSEINITRQLIGQSFMNQQNAFFRQGLIAKYPDIAYKQDGTLVDIQSFRPNLMSMKLPAAKMRNAHTHEAEHRAWLARQLEVEVEGAETLLVQGRGIQDLGIVPHPIVLSFVEALKENNAVERYVEHMAKQLYSGNEHSAVAGAYKNGLAYFIHGILSFSEGLNIMRRQYENAPDAPYSPEMLPFLKNEKICAPYQEGIDGLLVKLGFTYPAVRPAPNS